jgi:hypothetical protein
VTDTPDDPRPTVQRTVGLPADAATVRGLMQELAVHGWALMPDEGRESPTVRVREAGAGASEVHVSMPVAPDEEGHVGETIDASLADLAERVRRRGDAS